MFDLNQPDLVQQIRSLWPWSRCGSDLKQLQVCEQCRTGSTWSREGSASTALTGAGRCLERYGMLLKAK